MPDSIREQIIQKFSTLAAGILVASGYQTDIGQKVFRAADNLDQVDLPAINVVPLSEEAEQKYGRDIMTMPVQLEGFVEHGAVNTSVISERILADLRARFTAPAIKTTGFSPAAITAGFEGTASAAQNVLTFSDAADSALVKPGSIVTLTDGAERHVLTAAGVNAWTTQERGTIAAGTAIVEIQPPSLVDSVLYKAGGADTYAKAGESVTGCMIRVEVKYSTLIGNPYQQ